MANFRKLITIFLTAFFVIMLFQNIGMLGARLPFNFFNFPPLNLIAGYWFLMFAGFGFFIGMLFSMRFYYTHTKEVKVLRTEIKHLTEELSRHRTLSLDIDEPHEAGVDESEATQPQTQINSKVEQGVDSKTLEP